MVNRHLPARSSFRLARTAPSRLVLACALALSSWSACAATPAVLTQAPVLDAVADAVSEGGMWPVRIDLARLRAARSGDSLRFALPDGARLDVVFDSTIDQPDGVQWIGHLAAGRQFPVRLRLDGALASGVIRTPDGGYVLGHVDGRQLVGADLAAQADPVTVESLPAMFAPSVAVLDEARDTRRGADEPEPRKPADVAHPVTVDLVAMSALEPGADMALSIPDHGDYRVAYDRTEPGDTDSTTWVGHLKDYGQEFRVIITSGPNGSVGNILTPSGEILLVSDGGSQWLVDPQRSGLSQLEPDHADAVGEVIAGGPMAVVAKVVVIAEAMPGTRRPPRQPAAPRPPAAPPPRQPKRRPAPPRWMCWCCTRPASRHATAACGRPASRSWSRCRIRLTSTAALPCASVWSAASWSASQIPRPTRTH